jgi:hypothetical protein
LNDVPATYAGRAASVSTPASCVKRAAAPTIILLLLPRVYAIYFTSFFSFGLKGLVSSRLIITPFLR